MPLHKPTLAACAVLCGALALAACGSSKKSSSSSTSTPAPAASSSTPTSSTPSTTSSSASSASSGGLKLQAVETNGLSFDKKTLTAKAGKVTLTMDNASSNAQQHGIAVEGKGVDKDGKVVQPGGTSTVTVTLKPGTYEFYCPVPGHKQDGMEGKLTVQ